MLLELQCFESHAYSSQDCPQKYRLFAQENFSQNIYQVLVNMADTVLGSGHRVQTWKISRISYIIQDLIQDLSLILCSATRLLIPKCKISHAVLFILNASRISIAIFFFCGRGMHLLSLYLKNCDTEQSSKLSRSHFTLFLFSNDGKIPSALFFKCLMRQQCLKNRVGDNFTSSWL